MGDKKLKKLFRYELDYQLSYKYFYDTLDEVNILSINLLKLIDFKSGKFFTLLPESSDLVKIHEFNIGGILPPSPTVTNGSFRRISSYSIIPSIEEEISEQITEIVKEKEELVFLADDVLRLRTDKNFEEALRDHVLFNEQSVYYLLTSATISTSLVHHSLRESKSFWHSLFVLTKADFSNIINHELNLQKIKEICSFSELIGVGAYDGEGYIFWEKS